MTKLYALIALLFCAVPILEAAEIDWEILAATDSGSGDILAPETFTLGGVTDAGLGVGATNPARRDRVLLRIHIQSLKDALTNSFNSAVLHFSVNWYESEDPSKTLRLSSIYTDDEILTSELLVQESQMVVGKVLVTGSKKKQRLISLKVDITDPLRAAFAGKKRYLIIRLEDPATEIVKDEILAASNAVCLGLEEGRAALLRIK
jgi:hypothetical protein